jgi:hypothetical protein
MGVRFCFRSALQATLQQNRAPSTSTSQGVGQNKPPKWAKPSCQTQQGLWLPPNRHRWGKSRQNFSVTLYGAMVTIDTGRKPVRPRLEIPSHDGC